MAGAQLDFRALGKSIPARQRFLRTRPVGRSDADSLHFSHAAADKKVCCLRIGDSRSCSISITSGTSIIPPPVATIGTNGTGGCPTFFRVCHTYLSSIAQPNRFLYIERRMSQNKSVVIRPAKTLAGSVRLPGDKSISHRYAMLGGIAEGTTKLENFSTGADCASTLGCLRALGVKCAAKWRARL